MFDFLFVTVAHVCFLNFHFPFCTFWAQNINISIQTSYVIGFQLKRIHASNHIREGIKCHITNHLEKNIPDCPDWGLAFSQVSNKQKTSDRSSHTIWSCNERMKILHCQHVTNLSILVYCVLRQFSLPPLDWIHTSSIHSLWCLV